MPLAMLTESAKQVKTRMQLQSKASAAGGEYYNGMVDCFRKIVAKEGCVGHSAVLICS